MQRTFRVKRNTKKISKELNECVLEYQEEKSAGKKEILKEKIETLSYEYVQAIVEATLIRNSPKGYYSQEFMHDIAAELYVNRLAMPERKILENYDSSKGAYHTYISGKIIPNIYGEVNRQSLVKVTDMQNRHITHLKQYFRENNRDYADERSCSIYKEEAYEYVKNKARNQKLKEEDFNIIWQYFFNMHSNLSISGGSVEKEDTAIELEEKDKEDYKNVEIYHAVEEMLNRALKKNYITWLEAEMFKIEICDIYAIDIEDTFNIKGRFNSSISLEETGYKLLVTGLLQEHFPDMAKQMIERHPNKYRENQKRYEYLLNN